MGSFSLSSTWGYRRAAELELLQRLSSEKGEFKAGRKGWLRIVCPALVSAVGKSQVVGAGRRRHLATLPSALEAKLNECALGARLFEIGRVERETF
jgi:hypothetical protein